jgi:hypothetical protein
MRAGASECARRSACAGPIAFAAPVCNPEGARRWRGPLTGFGGVPLGPFREGSLLVPVRRGPFFAALLEGPLYAGRPCERRMRAAPAMRAMRPLCEPCEPRTSSATIHPALTTSVRFQDFNKR